MVNKGQQLRMKRLVERIFTKSCRKAVAGFEKELAGLGFAQTGGDQIALSFEHPFFELLLEITLDAGRCVHSYRIITFEEKNKRQQNVRW
jgi:hypothetical protein